MWFVHKKWLKWLRHPKRFKLKSATKLALFSTVMIVAVTLVLYAFLSSSFFRVNSEAGNLTYTLWLLALILFVVVPLDYFVSSLVIDKTLNPVRVMIEKVKSVGNRNFNSKIFIDSSEDELVEYALAFNQMSSKINEYVEAQKRFISDASHELTTPIAVIVGHADMLQRWGKDDPEKLSESLTIIKTEALAMNELVENLLFFTRSDNRRIVYDKKDIDLIPLIHDCVTEQCQLHPEFTIVFDIDIPSLFIHADSEAIRRVLRILFANSVKYSPDVQKITVTVEVSERDRRLIFSDCGVGVPDESLPKLFGRFFRVDDSRTKDTGGTGLGLAIAKEILNAHGYSIMAQNAKGGGLTMIIGFSSSNLHDNTLTSS